MTERRLFVAVPLDEPALRTVTDLVERIRADRERDAPGERDVRWVRMDGLHLTLRFLGSIEEELLAGIVGRLKKVAARHAPFEAQVRGLGAFPDGQHPRVLWAGVEGEAVVKLQRDVEAAVVELGFAPENVEKPFHPHITLGRVKESRPMPEWVSPLEFGGGLLEEIVVYESRTHSSGPEYVARARVALGKGD